MQRYNRHSVEVVTPPDGDLVSVSDMADYLVLMPGQDAGMLAGFIAAAQDAMARHLRRSLQTQTLRLTLDGFQPGGDDRIMRLGPGVHTASVSYLLGGFDFIDLPRGPVQSVTSITTFSRANASSVFGSANYIVDTAGGRIALNEGVTWPEDLRATAAVQIEYVAGYTTTPNAIVQGIKQHVAAMYECRSACDMPGTTQAIVESYRLYDELGWR